MALGKSESDILDVFLILNLPNMVRESVFVTAPLGFQEFIDIITIDNLNSLGFRSDLRDVLVDYILTRQIRDRPATNSSLRNFFL